MGDPEKLDPRRDTNGEEEPLDQIPVSGQFDLSEDELDMGDDYIASALAALENYQEPADILQVESGGADDASSFDVTSVAISDSVSDKPNAVEMHQRVEELESTLKEVRRKMSRQLEEQGNDLREAKRLIRQMRDINEELKRANETLGKDADEYKRKWQETASSYINFQKLSKKKMGEFLELEKVNIIRQFLPVIDNMQRPLEFGKASDSLIEGVRLIYKQFEDLLQSFDVQAISALGEKFDPYFHEAINRIQNASVPVNTVIEELQRGYQMGTRVIRPTRVCVSYGFPDDEPNTDSKVQNETENPESRIKDSNPDENSIESPGKDLSPNADSVDQRSGSDGPDRADVDQN